MTEPEKKTPEWLQAIVDRFSAVEEIFPEPVWMKGELPAWVQNVGRELLKAMYPTAHFKVGKCWEIGEVAALIGQNVAYFDSFAEFMDREESKDINWENLRKIFGGDVEERSKEFARQLSDEFFPAFEDAVKFSLVLATEQDFSSMSRFFRAFSKALDRRPAVASDVGRTNTRLYWILVMSYRRIEEFGSIPELHRRLCKCVFLGSHLVGNLKRVEKICERVGLSYREIAARKERAAKSDNGAATLSGDKRKPGRQNVRRGNRRSRQQRQAESRADKNGSGQGVKH